MKRARRSIDLRFEQALPDGKSLVFEDGRDRRWGWRVLAPELPERSLKLAEALRAVPAERVDEAITVHLTALRQACDKVSLLSEQLDAGIERGSAPAPEQLYRIAFHAGQAHDLANQLLGI